MRTKYGGAERDRTADPLLAKQVLSQLSYSPNSQMRLSGTASADKRQQKARSSTPLSHDQIRPRQSVHPEQTSDQIANTGRQSVGHRWPARPEHRSKGSITASGPKMVGPGRLELPTPRLSSVCSNQLSYGPIREPVQHKPDKRGFLSS